MPEAIIMMGLPLAGKSTCIDNKDILEKYKLVSADHIKEQHSDYDPDDTTPLHEYSVKAAEELINELAIRQVDIIMDGGGINNSYTARIIKMLKSQQYEVVLLHVKTPYWVCLERNKHRERKVPNEAITDKAIIEMKQFHRLAALVDEVIVEDYFTNKNIFIDMDGVIASQSTLPIVDGCIDFVNGEIFIHQKPVGPVVGKLEALNSKSDRVEEQFILSAAPNSISIAEKNKWLNKHFNIPQPNRYFVNQGKHKAEMLDNLRRKLKLDPKDVTLIEDTHQIIHDVKARGMNAMHVSEFLTHEF